MRFGAIPSAVPMALLVSSMPIYGSIATPFPVSIQTWSPFLTSALPPHSLRMCKNWSLRFCPTIGPSKIASLNWIWLHSPSSFSLKPLGSGAHRPHLCQRRTITASNGFASKTRRSWRNGKAHGVGTLPIIHQPNSRGSFCPRCWLTQMLLSSPPTKGEK